MNTTSNIEKYKNDIGKLIKSGEAIFKKMKDNISLAQLRQGYEMWYSSSFYNFYFVCCQPVELINDFIYSAFAIINFGLQRWLATVFKSVFFLYGLLLSIVQFNFLYVIYAYVFIFFKHQNF